MKIYTVVLRDNYSGETREITVKAVNAEHAEFIGRLIYGISESVVSVKEATK